MELNHHLQKELSEEYKIMTEDFVQMSLDMSLACHSGFFLYTSFLKPKQNSDYTINKGRKLCFLKI